MPKAPIKKPLPDIDQPLTESEIKLFRYKQKETEADEFGRLITVRRLKPSEQTKLAGMTSDLTGYDEMENEKGEKVRIPHRMPLMIAAAVCKMGDFHLSFPRTRAELDHIYDSLDAEGISAASIALVRLNNDAVENPQEEAKN